MPTVRSCAQSTSGCAPGEQTLTAALDNPDGHALYRAQEARADAEDRERRAARREAERLVCPRCGANLTDERWQQLRHGSRPRAGTASRR
ncbi:hypothetical protein P1P75_34365 [Streptomyces sp. ID05-39B]|uniref:hypothetical protein n=1 Tax=Streptomyces sp. ID05-39B TaxID=3028664 RepID=UPI0029BB13DF|nr:hypothetical protein [Streptomyces sp. ID05-39B]MDX3531335.1 hypothetical protein [Streptomyces sp. ID05-39B]MDX3531346.1 hypothetical protein [Streptomyces sp. ID05-39B]